jgi:hypothetical protein
VRKKSRQYNTATHIIDTLKNWGTPALATLSLAAIMSVGIPAGCSQNPQPDMYIMRGPITIQHNDVQDHISYERSLVTNQGLEGVAALHKYDFDKFSYAIQTSVAPNDALFSFLFEGLQFAAQASGYSVSRTPGFALEEKAERSGNIAALVLANLLKDALDTKRQETKGPLHIDAEDLIAEMYCGRFKLLKAQETAKSTDFSQYKDARWATYGERIIDEEVHLFASRFADFLHERAALNDPRVANDYLGRRKR